MTNKISRCFAEDADLAWGIVDSCSKWLSNKGMHHWRDYYTRDIVLDKIENAITYGVFSGNDMVGIGCLDEDGSDYYHQDYLDLCEDPSADALYMSMLAIDPDFHKVGFASKLIKFLEGHAKRDETDFIRLNAFTKYKELNKFYLKRKYSFLGSRVDEDGDEMSFYEKRLGKD